MKESFSSTSEEHSLKELLPIIKNLKEQFEKSKEYLRRASIDLKVGATILLSMGVFEVSQGQDMSHFTRAVDGVESGKLKIDNVINSFYDSYKQINIDSTFSYSEYSHSLENGKSEDKSSNISGASVPIGTIGDTISLGNVEAKQFFVNMIENSSILKTNNFTEKSKIISAIKVNVENNEHNSSEKEIMHTSIGSTPEEAIISAITEAASLKRSQIQMISSLNLKNELTSIKTLSSSNFVELNTDTTDEILNKVSVVVKRVSDKNFSGYSAEVYYK